MVNSRQLAVEVQPMTSVGCLEPTQRGPSPTALIPDEEEMRMNEDTMCEGGARRGRHMNVCTHALATHTCTPNDTRTHMHTHTCQPCPCYPPSCSSPCCSHHMSSQCLLHTQPTLPFYGGNKATHSQLCSMPIRRSEHTHTRTYVVHRARIDSSYTHCHVYVRTYVRTCM